MKLLIIRFSALGDVAMTVPVIKALAEQHAEMEISVLTRERFAPLFSWMPENVKVIGVELNSYHGLNGLRRLYRELKVQDFDLIADVHDVLRTKILRTFFRIHGCKIAVIDKGRKEKKALIGHGTDGSQLKTTAERYMEVFEKLGLPVNYITTNSRNHGLTDSRTQIGIAPFAAYETKMFPLGKMKKVVDVLADKGYEVYLFGGGSKEKTVLESWEREGVKSMCGKLGGLKEELEFIGGLDLMVAMDSGNLHLATMMGVKTISIWGATHPKAGFAPGETIVIQKDLGCRPCSIYGNKPCQYGDVRCMNCISPEEVIECVVRQTQCKLNTSNS